MQAYFSKQRENLKRLGLVYMSNESCNKMLRTVVILTGTRLKAATIWGTTNLLKK